jgi:murein tripeptide amidase MpaA
VRIYHRFEATQGFTAYNDDPACFNIPGNTTDYLVDWMDVLEACNPSVERILLGSSYEGRPLEALRLGPADRKHFVIDCMIHGNESDGLPGSLKAMEILLTHPDFEKLRNDFTLFFMPCCNPDGFYFGTRDIRKLGPHPSGVDKYINLNRVWPWYWDEFTPTANESKGAVPLTVLKLKQCMPGVPPVTEDNPLQ